MSQKVIISILAAVAIVALGAFFFLKSTPASAVKSVVEEHFVAISVADYAKAHTFLAKDKREKMDKDDLRYYVAGHSLLESNVKRTFKNVALSDESTAVAYVDVENVSGEKGSIDVFLVKEDGQWKVSSYSFVAGQ